MTEVFLHTFIQPGSFTTVHFLTPHCMYIVSKSPTLTPLKNEACTMRGELPWTVEFSGWLEGSKVAPLTGHLKSNLF